MAFLLKRPPDDDREPDDDRLPLRWAVIGLGAVGTAVAAAASDQPTYIVIGAALTVVAILHAIVQGGQNS